MKYLVCNLKANKNKDEMLKFVRELSSINLSPNLELIICPSTPFLYLFRDSEYSLGSQDISMFSEDSYTGEITGSQLASLNVKYALIGHSERRQHLKEDDLTIIEKIKKSYHSQIKPIYFIGETSKEKNNNETTLVIKQQITGVIDKLPLHKRTNMLIAYEPVWAIGGEEIPSYEDILDIIKFIKTFIHDTYGLNIPVLYGGSINLKNINNLSSLPIIDGFALGESAKNPESIQNIYNIIKKNIYLDKN